MKGEYSHNDLLVRDQGTQQKRRRRDCRSQWGKDIRRTWSTDSMKQGSFGLTETEASSIGPAWIAPGSLCIYVMTISAGFL